MKRMILRGTAALCAMAAAMPAMADDTIKAPNDAAESAAMAAIAAGEPIVVEPTLMHPTAGLMNDHMHEGGEFMIGLRWQRDRFDGANQSGTGKISDEAIYDAGYAVKARSMTMDMVMLDLMYAPTQDITLMVMPMWMRHAMTMEGIDPMSGMDEMDMNSMAMEDMSTGHSMLGYGETMSHATEGFADTLVSASYRLVRRPGLDAHATFGVWVPTGSVSKRGHSGNYVHYSMQPGSGTWDIEPALTVSFHDGAFGYGAQGSYKWRAEDRNARGYQLGDLAKLSGWASYALSPRVGAVARLGWEHKGAIEGRYESDFSVASPADNPDNYGGDTVRLGLGFNALLPFGGSPSPQIGVEFNVPLYQDLNGIQLPQDWRLSVALTRTF